MVKGFFVVSVRILLEERDFLLSQQTVLCTRLIYEKEMDKAFLARLSTKICTFW
jgi:hypothetical protein